MTFLKKFVVALALALALGASLSAVPARAESKDPLFINLTSDDAHRVRMALAFGGNQHGLGHGLTVFLNDKGVLVASKANADKFAEQQKMIADLVSKGATVLVCPMCMKHYGVKESDLLPGLVVGNPERTGAALFADNTKTLTW